jgi:hypothetical protein
VTYEVWIRGPGEGAEPFRAGAYCDLEAAWREAERLSAWCEAMVWAAGDGPVRDLWPARIVRATCREVVGR